MLRLATVQGGFDWFLGSYATLTSSLTNRFGVQELGPGRLGELLYTPWKTNMEPENDGLENDLPFQLGDFLGFMLIFRGVGVTKSDPFLERDVRTCSKFAWSFLRNLEEKQ